MDFLTACLGIEDNNSPPNQNFPPESICQPQKDCKCKLHHHHKEQHQNPVLAQKKTQKRIK